MTKLLLIITLMFQPVMLSYAMASMGHSHQRVASSMDHNTMHEMGDQQTTHDDSQNTVLENCCSSAACCPAASITPFSIARVRPATQFTLPLSPSWTVVALPTEIKPPRH